MVRSMCSGIVLANPELSVDEKYKVIRKREINPNKVSLISGGGSGHEPAHAGYIGKGMLDAAVCGDMFASPSQIQVYRAIQETKSEKGTLLVIKNYSGDVMNFKNAAAMTEDEVIVDYVIVNDDIAVKDSLYTVGRRGVAGTVLVHKIAGAAAELGWSLGEVKLAAEEAIANIRSVGFALSSCTVPTKGTPTFEIGDDEMEYGVGIHGEPGVGREKAAPAAVMAERMIGELAEDLQLCADEEVTLLVNGFGATPLQELYLLNHDACSALTKRNLSIHRTFVGNFMTSIDMMGASLTLMRMTPKLKQLLSEPCEAPAFRVDGPVPTVIWHELSGVAKTEERFDALESSENTVAHTDRLDLNGMAWLVDRMGTFIIENEVAFCELDAHAGDGDFGISVAKGFRELKREWHTIREKKHADIGSFLVDCALIIMENCGGASGPIWGSAFLSAGKYARGMTALGSAEFSEMLAAALHGIQMTGERSFGRGAQVGDKTLVDALAPCADAWREAVRCGKNMPTCFALGAKAAVSGAKATEHIVARMGRAGTVGERSLGYPDAGAYALGEIFTDLASRILEE